MFWCPQNGRPGGSGGCAEHAADFRFATDYCASVCTTIAEARSALEAVYEEIKRRAKFNAAHGVGSSRDLPDPPPSCTCSLTSSWV